MDPNDQRKLEIVPINGIWISFEYYSLGFGPHIHQTWNHFWRHALREEDHEDEILSTISTRYLYFFHPRTNVLIPYTLYSVTIVMQCGGSSMKTRT